MGWLGKLLGATPRKDLDGIQIDIQQPFWELDGETNFPNLLRALEDLLPSGSVLYFEDGSPNKKCLEFFKMHAISEQTHVAVSTLWPKPLQYHVPATPENLHNIAQIAESCAYPELAIHFHVYYEGKVLLEWHDAFTQPMLLAGDLPVGKVRSFAEALGMRTTKWKNSTERSDESVR